MKNKRLYISVFSLCLLGFGLLEACSSATDSVSTDENNPIDIGNSTISRSTSEATTVDWLKSILTTTGLNIKYGLRANTNTFSGTTVSATLKYDDTSKLYAFTNSGGKNAQWLSNGWHLFQGSYYPTSLLTSNNFSASEQSTSSAYADLSHYIFIPSDTHIYATISKVTIPYVHRLSRVLLNVYIDSDVKNGDNTAIIKGYNATDGGGSACMLRIKDVPTLSGVNSSGNPTWGNVSELIPHFLSGSNSLVYAGTTYSNVPQFDFIIRPIYNYYDDASGTSAITSQSFTISLTLDNGFQYTKTFTKALYPNQQITINLNVSREHVNYDDTMIDSWTTTSTNLDYFGTDNTGFTLSDAGGSWQRAYREGTSSPSLNVIDGNKYDGTEYIASVTDFIEALKTAKVGGAHHGDYFILTSDLVLPAEWQAFEFTGHLDGRGHTISFDDGAAHTLFTSLNGSYDDPTTVGDANIHLENDIYVPIKGYRAEIMNVTMANQSSLISGLCSGYLFNDIVTGTGTLYGTLDSKYGQAVNCQTK